MTDKGDNIYCYEYTDSTSGLMLVLNNGNNGKQTADLEYVDCGYYTSAGYKKTIPYNQDVAVTSVSVSKTSVSLNVGGTASVTATVAPSNASNKTITWSSSDTSVATVSGGTITAVKAGTATITAKSNNGKTATVTVTVSSETPVNKLVNNSTVSSTSVKVGDKVTLTAKASGGTAPYTYALLYKKSTASSYTAIGTKYGTASTGSFKPGKAVNYDVMINVKDADGTVKSKTFAVKVSGNTTTALVNNSTVSSTSVKVGDKVTLTAKASGGTAPYTYALLYKKSTSSTWFKIGTKYGTASTGSFKPGKAVNYDVMINVKDAKGTVKSKTFTIKVSASSGGSTGGALTGKSTVSSTSVSKGTKVTLKGAATGGTSPYLYAYYFKKSNSTTWVAIGNEYTTNTSAYFTPGTATTYNVLIKVMDNNGVVVSNSYSVKVI